MMQLINVKIEIEDSTGKKASLSVSEADNLSKLVIIQNVFNLFGITSDILETAAVHRKIAEAYTNFFDKLESIEPIIIKENDKNTEDIKQKLTDGYEDNKKEIDDTYKEKLDTPSHFITGIKTREDGKKTYRLRYKCIACYNIGNHFINSDSKVTWCHQCRHEMKVQLATLDEFPAQDTYGNFFRAGEFMDRNIKWV